MLCIAGFAERSGSETEDTEEEDPRPDQVAVQALPGSVETQAQRSPDTAGAVHPAHCQNV